MAPFVPAPTLGYGAASGQESFEGLLPPPPSPPAQPSLCFWQGSCLFLFLLALLGCAIGAKCGPGPPAACPSSVYPTTSVLRSGGRSPVYRVTLRETALLASASGRPNLEGWTWKAWASEPCHAPRVKVAINQRSPPLAQSPGNLFPGPGRLSKPWPAQPQCCWLRFPHFLVFSSPCCPRRCLLSGPAPTRPELDPREGECWKGGQGGGTGDREAA